ERARAPAISAELDRAAAWARGRFDALLAAVRDSTPEERVALDVTDVASVVASYARSIGDIEQQLPQEQQTIDPMLARSMTAAAPAIASGIVAAEGTTASASASHALRSWLVTWLADRLTIPESEVDPSRSFADHGLDSLTAVELAQDLSDHLARPLDETLLWNFGTINALVGHLEHGGDAVVAPPAPESTPVESRLDEEIARLEQLLQSGRTDHERV
ncbi:MAG: acyl carrier protein, partial [Solirubrobacteraceae bacterium]